MVPIASDLDSTEYLSNCGLNTAFLALELLDCQAPLQDVAQDIRAGPHFERQCSMADLKRCFEHRGLRVDAYKVEKEKNEILAYVRPGEVLVLHSQQPMGTGLVGHFTTLWGVQGGAVWIDPPTRPRYVPLAQISALREFQQSTGQFMVIQRPAKAARQGPAIQIGTTRIDLGDVPLTTSAISTNVPFRNVGTEPLTSKYQGTGCKCGVTMTGDEIVPPGASGTIHISIDKSSVPVGANEKTLVASTNDPNLPLLTLRVKFFVQSEPKKEDIRFLPQIIDYGRLARSRLADTTTPLRVIVPRDKAERRPQIKITATTQALRITPSRHDAASAADTNDPWIFDFAIAWDPVPAGPFSEQLRVSLDGMAQSSQTDATILIPLRGDSVETTAR
jgi:hypothetical protein